MGTYAAGEKTGEFKYIFAYTNAPDGIDGGDLDTNPGEFAIETIYGQQDGSPASSAANRFRVGGDDVDKRIRAVLKFETPANPSLSGNLRFTKLRFKVTTDDGSPVGGKVLQIFAHPITIDADLIVMNNMHFGQYNTGLSWGKIGGDFDYTTDYGHGTYDQDLIPVDSSVDTVAGVIGTNNLFDDDAEFEFNLDAWPKNVDLEWGKSYAILFKGDEGDDDTITSGYYAADAYTSSVLGAALTTGSDAAEYTIHFEDDVPEAPVITASPKAGGTAALIDVQHGGEADLYDLNTVWTADASLPDRSDSDNAVSDTQLTPLDTSKATHFDAGILSAPNTRYRVAVFARDQSHSYIGAADASQGAQSNVLDLARPDLYSVAKSGFTKVGDSGTITVTAATDVGNTWFSYGAAALKYLYIDWDGPSADATLDDDGVTKVEITAGGATSIARTHTYSTSGTKNVWVALEDTLGFRTNYERVDAVTGSTLPAPIARSPLPIAIASKKTHLHTKYGLIDASNVLNGIKSAATASDKEIYYYNWTHDQTTVLVTAYSTDNNNQYFDNISAQVKVKCNWGTTASGSSAEKPMQDAELTVYGIASFWDDDGTETKIADSHASFTSGNGYYRYTKEVIQPADTQNGYGSLGTNYWKIIDQIVVTNAPDNEAASYPCRYVIATSSGDGSFVNTRIASIKSHKLWGNFAEEEISGATVDKSNDYVEKSGENFFEDGFQLGDRVYVDFGTTDADGIYTIRLLTATRMTFTEEIAGTGTGATETVNVRIDTRRNVSLPYSTYHATSTTSTNFAFSISQERDYSSVSSVSIEVNHRLPSELDLNAFIDDGAFALMDATLSRSGGIAGRMPTGDRLYPIGISRTSSGLPTIRASFKVLSQTGLRVLWNLLEGNRYDWCLLESDRIDSPALPHRTFVLKLQDGELRRDGASGKHYTASLKFVAIGEEV